MSQGAGRRKIAVKLVAVLRPKSVAGDGTVPVAVIVVVMISSEIGLHRHPVGVPGFGCGEVLVLLVVVSGGMERVLKLCKGPSDTTCRRGFVEETVMVVVVAG